MCIVLSKSERKEVTGYKVVIKKGNHFYSPFTGIRYSLGKLPIPKDSWDWAHKSRKYRLKEIDYTEDMVGKTGVILNYQEAKNKKYYWSCDMPYRLGMEGGKYVILEMTITGDLCNAEFDSISTIVGRKIKSMKIID